MAIARFPNQRRPVRKTSPCKLFEDFERDNQGQPRTRNYRYDLNALADFEQEVGMGFGQLMQMKAAFAMVRALLWAGLKHEDRTLSIEYVGELVQDAMNAGATLDDLMTDAFEAAVAHGALGKQKEPDPTVTVEPAKPRDLGDGAVVATLPATTDQSSSAGENG